MYDLDGNRWSGILQFGKLTLVLRRQQISVDGEHLAQFHEGWPEFLKRHAQLLRLRAKLRTILMGTVEVNGNEAFQVQDLDEIPQFMMREHHGDVSGSFK